MDRTDRTSGAGSERLAKLAILTAAALFSTGGAALKLSTLSPPQLAAARSGIAALVLFVCVRSARRRPRRPADFLVPFAFGATMLLFVFANRATTAANTVLLQATAPLYLLLLGPWVLGERVHLRDILVLVGMLTGIGFVFAGTPEESATAPRPFLGDLLAASSGLTWALSILGLRWLGRVAGRGGGARRGTPISSVVLGNALVAIVLLPWVLPLPSIDARELGVLAWLGGFQIAAAYALVAYAIPRVRAFEASLLFLAEPTLSPLWAWWVHGEVPENAAVVGGGFILASAIFAAWGRSEPGPDPEAGQST